MSRRSRLAYSTETGSACKTCGEPLSRCRCAAGAPEEPVPKKVTARLRVEKSGRKGKTVTLIEGLPANRAFLDRLAKELKTACGSGGTAASAHIEIQGDQREKLRSLLAGKGFVVKG